jgi:hypothetical protein
MEAGYRARSDWCSQLDSVGSRTTPSATSNHDHDHDHDDSCSCSGSGSSGGLVPLLTWIKT